MVIYPTALLGVHYILLTSIVSCWYVTKNIYSILYPEILSSAIGEKGREQLYFVPSVFNFRIVGVIFTR